MATTIHEVLFEVSVNYCEEKKYCIFQIIYIQVLKCLSRFLQNEKI